MNRTYLVVFEKGSESWGAFAPDIPGTGGMGDSLEEARTSLVEGIGFMFEYAREQGHALPAATTTTVDFSAFGPDSPDRHYEIEWLTVELPTAPQIQDQAQQAA